MNIVFMGVYYYKGPTRHLYRIFEIYKALGTVFEICGYNVKYLAKQSDVLPLQNTYSDEKSFDDILKETDLLFMWNGCINEEREMAEKARQLGIPVYFSELGWLPQRGTFYFDLKGVNYESSLADFVPGPLSREQAFETEVKLAHYMQAHSTSGMDLGQDPFVFVPFQVESDSQIVNFSPRIKRMQELVDFCEKYVPRGMKIYFKKHPKRDCGDLVLSSRSKLFSEGNTHDFLRSENCRYVITINSTVGVEALAYFKPVINLGQAFYEGRLMTYPVHDNARIHDAIVWAERGDVAKGAILSFLHLLFRKQWTNADLWNTKKILSLIEGITDLRGFYNE